MAAPDRIPALVHTKKGLRALSICLLFDADAIERNVAEVAGVPAASLRVFPSEQAALEGSYAAPLTTFGDRLREQGQRPQRDNLQAAQYTFDGDTWCSSSRRRRCWAVVSIAQLRLARDSQTDYPSRDSEHAGVAVAPRWAVEHARGVFLANAHAVTNTADGGDEMSQDICRPDKGDVGDQPPVIPAPKTAPTAARVVKAAKDKAAAKKRHDI
eukprot:jgi/Tetstr1/427269/TSEL_017454.t1